jgi:hypothetical protein
MADDERKGVGDALTSLGSAFTSPAKLAFAGFVLLVYKGALCSVSFRGEHAVRNIPSVPIPCCYLRKRSACGEKLA